MNRLLLLLAFFVFPLQMTWAAMDNYCQQMQPLSIEVCSGCSEPLAFSVDEGPNETTTDAVKSVQDCDGHCSGQCNSAASSQSLLFWFPPSAAPSALLSGHILSTIDARPYRPQWLRQRV